MFTCGFLFPDDLLSPVRDGCFRGATPLHFLQPSMALNSANTEPPPEVNVSPSHAIVKGVRENISNISSVTHALNSPISASSKDVFNSEEPDRFDIVNNKENIPTIMTEQEENFKCSLSKDASVRSNQLCSKQLNFLDVACDAADRVKRTPSRSPRKQAANAAAIELQKKYKSIVARINKEDENAQHECVYFL